MEKIEQILAIEQQQQTSYDTLSHNHDFECNPTLRLSERRAMRSERMRREKNKVEKSYTVKKMTEQLSKYINYKTLRKQVKSTY